MAQVSNEDTDAQVPVALKDDVNTMPQLFCCKICKKQYTLNNNLSRHLYRAHADSKAIKCNHCDRRFTFLHELKVHMNSYREKIDTTDHRMNAKAGISIHEGTSKSSDLERNL